MGEVYLARDRQLNRSVAIKVLRTDLTAEPRRIARLEQEARAASALNHPNICHIYHLGETPGGQRYIAMEFVEGETLHERLAAGPLPLPDAIDIAVQVAAALTAAHAAGIVHRDVKPANVVIRRDRLVKVLDFGLAKLVGPALPRGTHEQTQTADSEAGVLVGTVEYMSPEQARGQQVDARTDIWALGVVLYQMIAGRPPFSASSRSDVLAAILEREPAPLAGVDPRVPGELRRIVGKMLRKDPERRYQGMKDVLLDLEALRDQIQAGNRFDADGGPQAGGAGQGPPAAGPAPVQGAGGAARSSPRVGTALLAGALGVGALVAAAAAWIGWSGSPTRPAYSLDLVLDGFEVDTAPALSPDGRAIVYRAGGRLWHRALNTFSGTALPDSDGAVYPFWSPDSRQIAFVRDGKVWRLPIGDSNAMLVTATPPGLVGTGAGTWTEGGELIVAGSDKVGLFSMSLNGGEPRDILPLDLNREIDFHQVAALPDRRGLLIAIHRAQGSDTIAALVNGERRIVLQLPGETIQAPVYSPAGYLLFERWTAPSGVWAVRFSIDRVATEGAPFLVVPGGSHPMIGHNGTLAFIRGLPLDSQLVSIDRTGSMGTIGELGGQLGQGSGRVMALSPDESRLALSIDHPGGTELWSYDLSRRSATRLSTGATRVRSPIWSPDGREVLFGAFGRGRFWNVYSVPADEAGEPSRALPESAASQWPCAISPDGRWLVYVESGAEGATDLWIADRTQQAGARPLLNTSFRETDAAFSPDGRSIAYVSDESGREEVYVRAFPLTVGRVQVSTDGGSMPAWAHDSQAIFYRAPNGLMEVAVSRTTGGVSVAPPRQLFTITPQSRLFNTFVVTSDGRFLFGRATGTPYVSVLLNWSPLSSTVSP